MVLVKFVATLLHGISINVVVMTTFPPVWLGETTAPFWAVIVATLVPAPVGMADDR
jgi:hypothetical protein